MPYIADDADQHREHQRRRLLEAGAQRRLAGDAEKRGGRDQRAKREHAEQPTAVGMRKLAVGRGANRTCDATSSMIVRQIERRPCRRRTSPSNPAIGVVTAEAHERHHELADEHRAADDRCDEKDGVQHGRNSHKNGAAEPDVNRPKL